MGTLACAGAIAGSFGVFAFHSNVANQAHGSTCDRDVAVPNARRGAERTPRCRTHVAVPNARRDAERTPRNVFCALAKRR
jgi:hypothetical protein